MPLVHMWSQLFTLISLLPSPQLCSSNSSWFMIENTFCHQLYNSSTRNNNAPGIFTSLNLDWFLHSLFLEESRFPDAWVKVKYKYPHSHASKWPLSSTIKHSSSIEHGFLNSLVLLDIIPSKLEPSWELSWSLCISFFIFLPSLFCSDVFPTRDIRFPLKWVPQGNNWIRELENILSRCFLTFFHVRAKRIKWRWFYNTLE